MVFISDPSLSRSRLLSRVASLSRWRPSRAWHQDILPIILYSYLGGHREPLPLPGHVRRVAPVPIWHELDPWRSQFKGNRQRTCAMRFDTRFDSRPSLFNIGGGSLHTTVCGIVPDSFSLGTFLESLYKLPPSYTMTLAQKQGSGATHDSVPNPKNEKILASQTESVFCCPKEFS